MPAIRVTAAPADLAASEAALTAAAEGTAVYVTDGYPARLPGSSSLPVTSR